MNLNNLFWYVASKIAQEPVEQLRCQHPEIARDYRLRLLAEEEAWDAYEVCTNCGKEWHG